MKKILVLTLLILPATVFCQGFMDRLKKRVQNKVEEKAIQKAEKGVDKGVDKAEDAVKKGNKPSGKEDKADKGTTANTPAATTPPPAPAAGNTAATTPAAPATPALKSNSRFDFVPGEQIVYAENFEQEAIGELPTGWNTSGTGEVVTLNNFPGKWLQLHQRSTYLTSNQKEFGENYTIEFDVILQLKSNGHFYPYLSVGFISTNGEPSAGNDFLRYFRKYACVEGVFYPADGGRSKLDLRTHKDNREYYNGDDQEVAIMSDYFGKPLHIAMQVQKERLRIWANQDKIFDAPKALAPGTVMNQLMFMVHSASYKEGEYGIYIGNLKVAQGIADTRHKLVEEGKFSTTGILFDINSDVIKPESYGVLKDIANVLKEHGDIKVKIVGHTDSDGEEQKNLQLSQKRAAAVVKALQETFGIEAARLQSEGKGETVPAGDNKTKEGKALNRRVEFIKL